MTNEPSEPQDEEPNDTGYGDSVSEEPADSSTVNNDVTEPIEQPADPAQTNEESDTTTSTDVFDSATPSDDFTESVEADENPSDDPTLDDYITDTTSDGVDDEVFTGATTDSEPSSTHSDSDQTDNFGTVPPPGATGFPGTAVPAAHYVPLLRDTNGVLGGVASGIGKRYGLDISIVRLGIVALAFTGIGILAYLAAWIIIPKSAVPLTVTATHPDQTRRALGAMLIGAAVIFGLSALGSSGAVLIPLTLLGAGIWLLMQPPATEPTPGQPTSSPGSAAFASTAQQTYTAPAGAYGSTQTAYGAPTPVKQRKSRTGLKIFGGLMAFASLLLIAGIAIIGTIVASEPDVYFEADSDNFQVDFGGDTVERVIRPTSLEDIPEGAFDSEGTLVLDLSDVEVTAADRDAVPFESEFGVGAGRLEVIAPADLDIRFETNVDEGFVDYQDKFYEGDNISRDFGPSDPDLILDLNVREGEIVIIDQP